VSPELPSRIPLFPLPNVVLFPGVALPLHIFEPRYREMVRETLATPHRMIGMTLLRGDWRQQYYGYPQIFAVGCAGRVVSSEPLADGRYNIRLHGVREFVLAGESHDRAYRLGTIEWRPAAADALSEALRSRLRVLIERLTSGQRSEAAVKLFDDLSIPDELIVNFFCFALDFAPVEKQSLLEAVSIADRAERLADMAEFALNSGTLSSGGESGGRPH